VYNRIMDATIENKLAKYMQKLIAQQTRDNEMKRLRWVEGMTLQKIADRYGLTRSRVQQITGKKAQE